jgi:hypothetical protein
LVFFNTTTYGRNATTNIPTLIEKVVLLFLERIGGISLPRREKWTFLFHLSKHRNILATVPTSYLNETEYHPVENICTGTHKAIMTVVDVKIELKNLVA